MRTLCLLAFPFLLNGCGGALPCGAQLIQLQLFWCLGCDEFVDPHILFMSRSKLTAGDAVVLLNKYRERRATMRFNEIASADDQLALWRLISDNVWSAVLAQAKEQARLKAQAAATPKPKRIQPKKIVPKKPPAPKPKPPAPRPPPPKSPVPQQAPTTA